jgi:hypothetical protein
MSDLSTLKSLLERVEKAEGPDNALDIAIDIALFALTRGTSLLAPTLPEPRWCTSATMAGATPIGLPITP